MDESNPWIGVTTQKVEKKRPQDEGVDRRNPRDERAIHHAEILAGLKGEKKEHAVRFGDLDNLHRDVQAKLAKNNDAVGSIGKTLAVQFAAIDSESKQLLDEFNNAFTEVENEIAILDDYVADYTIYFEEQLDSVYAELDVSYYTIAETDMAISAVQTSLNSSIGAVSANLSANYYTRSSTDSAISAAFNSYTTIVNGNTANISSVTSSVNGIRATYGIKTNINGHVAGFGLISKLVDGLPVSDFIIADASFRIVNSSGAGNYTPFAVYPTGRTIGGVFIPAGVHAQDLYVTNANIGNAQIDTAKIKDLAVDTLKIAGNAVTVPVISYGFGTKVGDGEWQTLASVVVDMPVAGENVALMWNISQGYSVGTPSWGFRLRKELLGGAISTLFSREGMNFGNDYPSGTILATSLPTGPSIFYLDWKGQNSNIQAEGVLTGIGVAR